MIPKHNATAIFRLNDTLVIYFIFDKCVNNFGNGASDFGLRNDDEFDGENRDKSFGVSKHHRRLRQVVDRPHAVVEAVEDFCKQCAFGIS